MNYFLETIKTTNKGVSTAEVAKYDDEMTAAIFFHNAMNVNIRLVQDKTLDSFYANVHTDSGVVLKQERWSNVVPEPVEP